MFKTCVHGSWVYVVRPSELTNSPQPLKRPLLNDFALPGVERYEPVDWASYLENPVGIGTHALVANSTREQKANIEQHTTFGTKGMAEAPSRWLSDLLELYGRVGIELTAVAPLDVTSDELGEPAPLETHRSGSHRQILPLRTEPPVDPGVYLNIPRTEKRVAEFDKFLSKPTKGATKQILTTIQEPGFLTACGR